MVSLDRLVYSLGVLKLTPGVHVPLFVHLRSRTVISTNHDEVRQVLQLVRNLYEPLEILLVHYGQTRLTIVHLVNEPAFLVVDVYGNLNGSQQVGTKPRQDDLHAVWQHDQHPVTGLHTQSSQSPGETQAVFVQPCISEWLVGLPL